MEPYTVYKYYLALRLHFTTDNYDVVKQQGRVRGSKQAFFRRKDLLAIRKVADTYSDKDVVEFLVANFVGGDRWGGVFDTQARERYLDWKKRIESLTYNFQKEVNIINNYCQKNNVDFSKAFEVNTSRHPPIVSLYLRNDVSLETMVILNTITNFCSKLDNELKQDIVWPDVSRMIKKYEPFLTFKKEKYDAILRRTIGHN
jgi:hypothetical protein